MGMIINAQLPADGVAGIRPGQIFEAKLFTDEMLKSMKGWKLRKGTIQDRAHAGVEVIQFISKNVSMRPVTEEEK